jgi:predicted secreted protein
MGFISGIVVFLMIWWTALFAVLPWGNRPAQDLIEGQVASAPDKPRLLKKFLITTAISVVLWCIVYGLISSNVINFYDMAADMAAQDDVDHVEQSFRPETGK